MSENVIKPPVDKIGLDELGHIDIGALGDSEQERVIVVARAFLDRVQSSLDVDLRAPVDGELDKLRNIVASLTMQLLKADIHLAQVQNELDQEQNQNTKGQATLMAVVITAMRRLGLTVMDIPDDVLFPTMEEIHANPQILDADSVPGALRMILR
jgi:hypothetical protein